MTPWTLTARSLRHFWRTNIAVALGVAVAVSTLAGALVVGSSVRSSLEALALARLGRADHIVAATTLFSDSLASRLERSPTFRATSERAVALLALDGIVVHEPSGHRAGSVQVFGVDDRFWALHGVEGVAGPEARDAYLSPGLARELGATSGDALLLRLQKPSAIPSGVLQGRRDDPGRAMRATIARVLSREEAGEFSPRPQQGEARAIFVPLSRLQREIELPGRANMLLVRSAPEFVTSNPALAKALDQDILPADLGVRIRPLPNGRIAVESDAGFLTDTIAQAVTWAVRDAQAAGTPVLTYLANTIGANGKATPYSLVSALPADTIARELPADARIGTGAAPIWLNAWTADDLSARIGDAITLDYYTWSDVNGLETASATFQLAGILPMRGLATDRDLTPEYPGVSTSEDMAGWDPPFPVDLSRVRKKDEDYWKQYRTAPKAFITIEDGQRLWRSRYGSITSLRATSATSEPLSDTRLEHALAATLSPSYGELRVIPALADARASSAGTTDFGEYFTYFSFFVVVASLLLTVLFFRLGTEQRAAEIGVLAALGYAPRTIARMLLSEGIILALAGAAVGTLGAIAYAGLVMLALRTLWIGAVGTTALTVHVSPAPLVVGAVAGVVAAAVCVLWSLRVLMKASARRLMSGGWLEQHAVPQRARLLTRAGIVLCILALGLVAASALGLIPAAAGFFGSGSMLLIGGLCLLAARLRGRHAAGAFSATWPLWSFGVRNARYRPSRSVLSTALIAAATFLIVAVGAFRQGETDITDRSSASGGYQWIGETVIPLMHDPSTEAGRDALNLQNDMAGLEVARFRLRPGDDASCLNLYRPRNPRLLGAPEAFIESNRFGFSASLAESPEERANPWRLLTRTLGDRVVPVIGDATSLTYTFHLAVGDELTVDGPDGQPLRLRIVGALRSSVLQSELIMSEAQFTHLFPRIEGYRVFLFNAPPARAGKPFDSTLEGQLEDFGLDVQATRERLAAYHRVENTYLSTFQALGGLGLVLGTFGLGAVLLRNVLERRRELAVLRATGYQPSHLTVTIVAESLFLMTCGLVLGIVSAAVAIAPTVFDRGEAVPVAGTVVLLVSVLAAGLLSTGLATRAMTTTELLPALRSE